MNKESIKEFINFVSQLKGDEKGEAQLFIDRFFRAFGHGGIIEAEGSLETRIKFSTGRTKFADCIWIPKDRPGVLIEMKKKSEYNLGNHFPQARDYWIEMNPELILGEGSQKPKFILLCNFDKFLIYKDLSFVDEIKMEELEDRLSAFNFMLPVVKEPIFKNNTELISQEAAKLIGEIFKYLVYDKQQNREKVQKFLLQCVLALFSEDFGLLPNSFFSEIIRDCINGSSSYDLIGGLFRQMALPRPAEGGRFVGVSYFNGGLFENVDPIELDLEALKLLKKAGDYNWKNVNPAIFGSLFESTMSSEERHAFGAHFTNETDIYKIINPTIIKPWKKKIEKAKTLNDLTDLLFELMNYTVLDPSCGCGNFLFVAYKALKDLEFLIIEKIAKNFTAIKHLRLGISKISIKQFKGIDIQPLATEVAKMTMMIAKEILAAEWNKRIEPYNDTLGLVFDMGLPLDSLDDTIVCKDAILEDWPTCDVIVGNPPYQSKNKMKEEMDHNYINNIRHKYPEIPGRADYCVFWFRKAHYHLKEGQLCGLVGTNTIRQTNSRIGGLDYIVENNGTIIDAVSTQVWSGEAVVYVSIVNWIKGEYKGTKNLSFQVGDKLDSPFVYHHPKVINSSLSIEFDVSSAKSLITNKKSEACYQGQTHGHKGFLLTKKDYEDLITRNNDLKKVIFPYLIGNDLLKNLDSKPKRFVVDFSGYDVFEASGFEPVFSSIKNTVYIDKKSKAEKEKSKNDEVLSRNPNSKVNKDHTSAYNSWWLFFRQRSEMIQKINLLNRYIVCSRVTKRPIFEFISNAIHPNDALQVFPLNDYYSFGILQSKVHWIWFKERCSTLKGDWRYTSDTVFDSFPWPQEVDKKGIELISKASKNLRNLRRRIMIERKLSLRDLYRLIDKTPNNPVTKAQDELDELVINAYGFDKKSIILEELLNLNHKLSSDEDNGLKIIGPGVPEFYENYDELVDDECVSM